MTVMEIWPGGGWYTEVLAPVMRHHGQFIVAGYDVDIPGQPEYRYRLQLALMDKFSATPGVYDQVAITAFSPPESASLGEAETVDMILTFRNTHGWVSSGIAESIFVEFAHVLKPGGVLGVVQHRADKKADPKVSAETGYVSEEAVIALARGAGLYLEARSEVNANSADTKDHEGGVWTLPPSLALCRDIEGEDEIATCRKKYQAIGESDRMTLKRAVTQYWDIWVPPFGRAGKRSFAVLRLWARTSHCRRDVSSATAPCVALPPASVQSCAQPLPNSLNS